MRCCCGKMAHPPTQPFPNRVWNFTGAYLPGQSRGSLTSRGVCTSGMLVPLPLPFWLLLLSHPLFLILSHLILPPSCSPFGVRKCCRAASPEPFSQGILRLEGQALCVFCVASMSTTHAVEAFSVGEEFCWGGGAPPLPPVMCDWGCSCLPAF